MDVHSIDFDRLMEVAATFEHPLPIEQTELWAQFEATVPGKSPWGCVEFTRDGATVAVASFSSYKTHGFSFLRSHHGPVWAFEPSEADETEALEALRAFVRKTDRSQAFARLGVLHALPICEPTLSITPYDTTVVVDLSGDEDALLSRMKQRGRRDVRKALRESPVVCADETERATEDFAEYYEVMVETGKRDGFTPAPCAEYQSFIRILGSEHCRVFAGRVDGRVVTWSVVTIQDGHATKYFAGSRNETMRSLVTDKLAFFEICELQRRGCADYDLMGIGSEEFPGTQSLNTFKTKFSKDGVRHIAPDRDLPIRRGFYRALVLVKRLRTRLRQRS